MDTFEQLKQKIISLASQDIEIDGLWLYGSHA